MTHDVRRVAEDALRASYGRLLALLAARTRGIAAAEDALSEAFRITLKTWPTRGVPDRPEAWLLTTARHAAGHAWRHARNAQAAQPAFHALMKERTGREAGLSFEPPDPDAPSERLDAVLSAVYPAYGLGWDDEVGTDLAQQALFLGRLLVQFLPGEPEARGFPSLMLHCEACGPRRLML